MSTDPAASGIGTVPAPVEPPHHLSAQILLGTGAFRSGSSIERAWISVGGLLIIAPRTSQGVAAACGLRTALDEVIADLTAEADACEQVTL